jgi:MFS family permease
LEAFSRKWELGGMLSLDLVSNNADYYNRWIFYLNLPIVAIGFVGVTVSLKLEGTEKTFKERISEIDYLGSFIFVASTTSFLVPITWGGVMFSWSSWHTLVPLLLGLAGLVGFCIYETRATYTLLPLAMFRNSSTSITYLITFLHGVILWAIVYYIPFYFMAVLDYTPILAGVSALPQSLTVVPCAVLVGIIASKTGRYSWSLWIGWGLTVLGIGLLCLLDTDNTVAKWIFLLLISGIGIGLLFPAMNLSIQASVDPEHISTAAGMFTFFGAFGQTIGVAM